MNANTITAADFTTSAIRNRAMSADTSGSTMALHIEAARLADIVAAHQEALEGLWERQEEAELAGNSELRELYTRMVDTLKEDDRSYWAWARLEDIKRRLGASHSPQVTMGF